MATIIDTWPNAIRDETATKPSWTPATSQTSLLGSPTTAGNKIQTASLLQSSGRGTCADATKFGEQSTAWSAITTDNVRVQHRAIIEIFKIVTKLALVSAHPIRTETVTM